MVNGISYLWVGVFLFGAIFSDIREHRIQNGWILLGVGTSMIYAFWQGGVSLMLVSLCWMSGTVIVLFLLFLWKGIGAGDIKLLGVMAAFFQRDILWITAAAFFAASIFILLRMLMRFIKRIPVYKKGETIPFSIPIAVGVCMVEVLQKG